MKQFLKPGFHYMFQWSEQIGVVHSCERYCIFAGFHRPPLLGFLRDILYMKVCKSSSESGIKLEITTFRKQLLIFFVFSLAHFFQKTENFFVTCVIGSYRSQSQHIAAQASHPLVKVQHVQLCCEHTSFCCEGWGCLRALMSIYRETSSTIGFSANTCMKTSLYNKLLSTTIFGTSQSTLE